MSLPIENLSHAKNLMPEHSAIAVFDSGVGGLSVLQHIHRLLPNEHLNYLADSRYAPYGNKSPAEISERALVLADALLAQSSKVLVVACNTATAYAITALRLAYPHLPIIGMEPALKPAVAMSQNKIIGVLATSGTLDSGRFATLLDSYASEVTIVAQAGTGLVECIEQGELDSPHMRDLVRQHCTPLLEAGVDTIVLGCTHYPFIQRLIREVVGDGIHIIDTGEAVARRLQQQLSLHKLLSPLPQAGKVTLWHTHHDVSYQSRMLDLWQRISQSQIG